MGFLPTSVSVPSPASSFLGSAFPPPPPPSQKSVYFHHGCGRSTLGFHIREESSTHQPRQDKPSCRRRQILTLGTIATTFASFSPLKSTSFAAEGKKGYLPVIDQTDGYAFYHPFGWEEISIKGQDKVFKDVIEPLESVSVNIIPTLKQDLKDLGSPQEVSEALINRVLAPSNQKTKLIEATEHDVDGQKYYKFEFLAKAPNFTRHAIGIVTVGNGRFYTLTTGANERRWTKVKDSLRTVVDSFKIFEVKSISSN
ncbi:PsbP-like protein 1 [Zostera marina]|uniref:PsbP-like protein 1 n=1 Tax=Zostera marina TaxID=29655 RepID=A0A0K9P3Z6_ZOSMR|nr:PsbP-like protein 1 [Zostera marina]